ncbi:MAG: hypothetical protein PUE08_05650 [Eubacteriales bacterium]|nr:hypothetical protein [Eubacteriales bacterium]
MIYTEWMKYIKDDVKLNRLVIPGAHNAGSYGMGGMAQCQDDNLFVQFQYGIRQYCLRLNTDRKGNIVLAHGISKGDLFENALKDIKKALELYPDEFILLDVREYYPQKFGPITLTYKADKNKVNALLKKYLDPEKNAYYDFDHISDVTVGDIRNSSKRFILINENEDYEYSKNCEQILPWEKAVNGAKAEKFVNETLRFFDDYKTDGLYWFQTQQTPNLGTEIGVTRPKKLDDDLVKYFHIMIDGIANTPRYLERSNIIAGDFMTRDYSKCSQILMLNFLKGNVKDELKDEYENGLKEQAK